MINAWIDHWILNDIKEYHHYIVWNILYWTDEREKYDPTGFRDAILLGLEKTGNDLEAISKYLDSAGSKLDYRRYGEALFDILIAGGLLVPGGSIAQDGDKPVKTTACVFEQPEDMESMRNFEQVLIYLSHIIYREKSYVIIVILTGLHQAYAALQVLGKNVWGRNEEGVSFYERVFT